METSNLLTDEGARVMLAAYTEPIRGPLTGIYECYRAEELNPFDAMKQTILDHLKLVDTMHKLVDLSTEGDKSHGDQ